MPKRTSVSSRVKVLCESAVPIGWTAGAAAVESLFAQGAGLLSSRLLEVELHSIVERRGGSHEDVEAIVRRVDLDAVDDDVVDHALALRSGLRAMDALHLSTALLYGGTVTEIATYDKKLAAAAQRFGLTLAPGCRWLRRIAGMG